MSEDEAWKSREKYYKEQACSAIQYISWYCYIHQSCTKCSIKEWCKEKRKQCPEEWRRK